MTIPAVQTAKTTNPTPRSTHVAQKGSRRKSNTVKVHGCKIQRGSKTPATIPSLKCQVRRLAKTSAEYRRISRTKVSRRAPKGAKWINGRKIKVSFKGQTRILKAGHIVTLQTKGLNMGPTFQVANVARCMINGFFKKGNKVYAQVMVRALIKGTQTITNPARVVPLEDIVPQLSWMPISTTEI